MNRPALRETVSAADLSPGDRVFRAGAILTLGERRIAKPMGREERPFAPAWEFKITGTKGHWPDASGWLRVGNKLAQWERVL